MQLLIVFFYNPFYFSKFITPFFNFGYKLSSLFFPFINLSKDLSVLLMFLNSQIFFFFFSPLFRAAPSAHGSSQARGRTGATAAGLHHSNGKSEPHLWPSRQLMAMPDPDPVSKAEDQTCIFRDTAWLCFRCTTMGTPNRQLLVSLIFFTVFLSSSLGNRVMSSLTQWLFASVLFTMYLCIFQFSFCWWFLWIFNHCVQERYSVWFQYFFIS